MQSPSLITNTHSNSHDTTAKRVLDALQPYRLAQDSPGQYRCDSPFRADSDSNGFCVTIADDGEYGAYYDQVTGERGSLYDLAKRLGITLPERIPVEDTKRSYRDLDEYARVQGVPVEVFTAAGVSQTLHKGRPALAFPTDTGVIHRYIDGKSNKQNGKPDSWVNPPNYQKCWYGLNSAVEMANATNHPLVITNGITSVIVAQHYGVPSACITGGEPKEIPVNLLKELQEKFTGPILLAPDNDQSGKGMVFGSSTKPGLLKQLQDTGYQVRALDLGLGNKGDLANYCSLHEENSMQRLLQLDELKPTQTREEQSAAKSQKLTHPDLGNMLIQQWDGNVAYFRDGWYRYNNGWWHPLQRDVGREIWHVMQPHKESVRPTANARNSIGEYLKDMLHVPDEKIDRGDSFINLRNGLYNLESGILEPHQRDLYLTSRLDFDYDPQAKAPNWEAFLGQILVTPDGEPDQTLIELVQEAIGYSLTTDMSFQKSFWLVGQPASGKSTFIDVLIQLMGNAYGVLDLSTLDRNGYQLADVPGKRIVLCSENATNTVIADNIYKQLVSGDEMIARQIHREPFRFRSQAKIWWGMNETPRNLDRSGAIDRRVLIIPFNRPIPECDQDPHMLNRLVEELSGIFNWALVGLERLRQNEQFTVPNQVAKAREEYRLENDTESAFVSDWCQVGKTDEVTATDLYAAYKLWCEHNGHRPKSKNKVGSDWKRLGFLADHTRNGTVYRGVSLTIVARKSIEFRQTT